MVRIHDGGSPYPSGRRGHSSITHGIHVLKPDLCGRMRKTVLAFLLPALTAASAQTFTAPGGTIPDDASTVDFPIEVMGLVPATIDTVSFGIESVCIEVVHDWTRDLDIQLVAPDGTTVLLLRETGYGQSGFSGTCFRHDATEPIGESFPPHTGTYFPIGQLGSVNNGQDANGTWYLRIRDDVSGFGTGSLTAVGITFDDEPAPYFNFRHSDLPIVSINTFGTTIPNDPKITAHMGIIDNGTGMLNELTDPFNAYDGYIGIETRGNSSQMFVKKSYGFETRDSLGENNDVVLLGLPEESDWVLIANNPDKSLLNNALTFDLAQRMGHYAPRWRHVEVVLNGEYVGVYLLTEKIKRDGDRVDIAKLLPTDTLGDDVTGGYILKVDWAQGTNLVNWVSDYAPPGAGDGQIIRILMDHPDEPHPAQAAYIEAYVDSFENALAGPDFSDTANGFRRFLDERSAIDYFLLSEFARNVDGYRQSTFFHKDKDSNGGKLKFGPVWDFDLGYGSANYCGATALEGWDYLFSDLCSLDVQLPPFWWGRLLEDSAYTDSLRCRWESLRTNALDTVRLDAWCDSMASGLAIGQQQNFTIWRTLGYYVWPNPLPVPETYAGEIQELKDWMHGRWLWLDQNIPGTCDLSTDDERPLAAAADVVVFPDPFQDRFVVRMPVGTRVQQGALVDMTGRNIGLQNVGSSERPEFIVPHDLADGSYVLRLSTANGPLHVSVMRSGQ